MVVGEGLLASINLIQGGQVLEDWFIVPFIVIILRPNPLVYRYKSFQ